MATKTFLANIRGIQGHSITSVSKNASNRLIVSISDGRTIDVGDVRGPQGIPGVNAVDNDAAVAGYVSTAGDSQTKAALAKATALAQASPISVAGMQGLYSRTVPTPNGGTAPLRVLARDPLIPGRIWAQIQGGTRTIGYSDDSGATFVSKFAPDPAFVNAGIPRLMFNNGYAWMIVASTDGADVLRRSPYPDSAGNGWSWTNVFNFAAPPTGITVGVGANMRSDSVAVFENNVYLAEYANATITGGPSIYYSANSGVSWSKVKTWANARHIHAVIIVNGFPWISIGDLGNGWVDRGIWSAATVSGSVWIKRTYGEGDPGWGGNEYVPINMLPMSVGGAPMIVGESDTRSPLGPLIFGTQGAAGNRPLIPAHLMPMPYFGSMRHITLTSEGNLLWLQTGERGGIGDFDAVVMSKGPNFSAPVIMEAVSAVSDQFASAGDSVVDGEYVWFGSNRIRRDRFAGQAEVTPPAVPTPAIVPMPLDLAHRWSADDAVGASGAVVSSWTDSVSGKTLGQAVGGSQPTITVSGADRYVRFDGADDWMESVPLGMTQPATILITVRLRSRNAFLDGFIAPSGTGWQLSADGVGKLTLSALPGTVATANGAVPTGVYATLSAVVDASLSRVGVNAVTPVTGVLSGSIQSNYIRVGYAYTSGAARYAAIDVREIRVYRRALTVGEVNAAIATM